MVDDRMRITSRIPHYVVADLDTLAKEAHRTRNGQMIAIIEDWLKTHRAPAQVSRDSEDKAA